MQRSRKNVANEMEEEKRGVPRTRRDKSRRKRRNMDEQAAESLLAGCESSCFQQFNFSVSYGGGLR